MTDRDTIHDGRWVDSAVRAGALQGFDELVRHWGADPIALRRHHGLDGVDGSGAPLDPDAMVSLDAVGRLLEDAAQACGRADFGLRLGSRQNSKMLGLLAVVLQGADSLAASLLDVSRYLFVHSPSYQIVLEEPDPATPQWVTLRFDVRVGEDVPYRQLIDGCLISMLTLSRDLTQLLIEPLNVSLPHTPIASPKTYEQAFGGPVAFEQPKAAFHLDPALLTAKLDAAKPEIRRRALAYIHERYPPTSANMTTRVRNALGGTIGATRGTKAEIADLFGLHPRTLQRRLNAEGATFEAIREDVYRQATARLLTDSTLPLGQIAHALGFSEQSAMSRSVRRWFGLTPSAIRRKARQPSATRT